MTEQLSVTKKTRVIEGKNLKIDIKVREDGRLHPHDCITVMNAIMNGNRIVFSDEVSVTIAVN